MNHTGSYICSSKYTTAVHVNIVRSLFFACMLVKKTKCVCTLQNGLSKSYSEESGGFQ